MEIQIVYFLNIFHINSQPLLFLFHMYLHMNTNNSQHKFYFLLLFYKNFQNFYLYYMIHRFRIL
nr:MAG TPA: hypothetical protein [Caudoviricetes sp.]